MDSEILRSIALGVIQGLTEFLPVSSSGHIELAKYFLGDESVGSQGLLMTVTLHVATALSTALVFRKDIAKIFNGLYKGQKEEFNFSLKIIVSMIPAVFVGLALEGEIEQLFNQNILLVGFMLIITGLLLFLADRAKKTNQSVGYGHAFIIGITQAIAILPGISRSGATISTSVLLGIDREQAARFSFLMVIPLILGKMIKDIFGGEMNELGSVEILSLLCGFVAAFVTGAIACTWMIRLVKNSKLSYFSVYCFVIAAFSIIAYVQS